MVDPVAETPSEAETPVASVVADTAADAGGPRLLPAIDLTWIGLIALTFLTWLLADSAELGLGRSGLILIGIGTVKGLLIAAVFMELAHRSRLMLALVGGYLLFLWLVLWAVLAR